MQNDFEKNITQRLQDFSLPPQPEIWQRVEAALPPEKKRRRLVFWWWLPVVALLAGGIWFIPGLQKSSPSQPQPDLPQAPGNHLPTAVTKTSPAPIAPVNHLPVTTNHVLPTEKTTETAEKKMPVKEQVNILPIETKQHTISPTARHRQLFQVVQSNGSGQKGLPTSVITPSAKEITEAVDTATALQPLLALARSKETSPLTPSNTPQETPPVAASEKAAVAATDSGVTHLQNKDSLNAIQPDTAVKTATVSAGKPFKKRSAWMLEASIGLSGLYPSAASNNLYAANSYSSFPGAGQIGLSGSTFSLPRSSYSFNIGISRNHSFSAHWQGQVALRYQLLSSLQWYGALIGRSVSADSLKSMLYSTGRSQTHHNYSHQLQLAPGFTYILHPTAASPLHFHAGFSVAYNGYSNLLLHDYRNGYYVRSSAYTTRWLVNAEVGAGIFIHQKIYTGITYQQGLSNVARPALRSDYHWRAWQLQVSLPLFHSSSK